MKIAIVGSRKITDVNIEEYLPATCEEIISGGAVGVDKCAERYALENRIRFTVFLPEYKRYGRGAPILRNKEIVNAADEVLIFWDGSSRGTKSVLEYCDKISKPYKVIICKQPIDKGAHA